MAYRLDPAQAVERGLREALLEQVRRAADGAADPRGGSQAQRVHRARTTCKKVRAGLRLLRTHHPGLVRRENRLFRTAGRRLAPLREAETMLATFAGLATQPAAPVDRHGFGQIRQGLLARRREIIAGPGRAERALGAFAAEMRRAERRLLRPRLSARDFGRIGQDLRLSYRRARRAFRAAEEGSGAAPLHRWRKAAKRLGYQCRLLRGAWPPLMKAFRGRLDALSHLLGDLHDLAVLRDYLGTVGPGAAPPEVLARAREFAERRAATLRAQALAEGRFLFDPKPRAWAGQVGRWWAMSAKSASARTGRRRPPGETTASKARR